MPKKCCVMSCNGNYNKENKEKVLRLPSHKEERTRWISIIPCDNIPDSNNTVVCKRHFPSNYKTIVNHGKKRPRDPPSLFTCVKLSLVLTKPGPSRTTKPLSEVRKVIPDEIHFSVNKIK